MKRKRHLGYVKSEIGAITQLVHSAALIKIVLKLKKKLQVRPERSTNILGINFLIVF